MNGRKTISIKRRSSGPELHKAQLAGIKDPTVRKKMKKKVLKKKDSGGENPYNRINFR